MPDIRFGTGSDDITRVSDGLNDLIVSAMKIGGYTSKAQFAREAMATFGGWIIAKENKFTCETCGSKVSVSVMPPKFIYQCDCD